MDSRKENTSELVPDSFLRQALKEDIGSGDLTTDALVSKKEQGKGRFLAKQHVILCGTTLVERLFKLLGSTIQVRFHYHDGDSILPGKIFGEVTGPLHLLLKGERTALNLLQRLSGISTLTHEYQKKIKNQKTKILDTRKTLPLYRKLEKYAVKIGGAQNHRMGLYDQMLIKDNHISACKGDIGKAVHKARKRHPGKILVVEIQSSDQIEPAIQNGADRLLLDNMDNQTIKKCLSIVRRRIPIEVSGQISTSRLSSLSKLGVEYISVGAITHSAPGADISFKIDLLQ